MQKSNLLPPANKVCEGYVFTRVCLSTGGVFRPTARGSLRGLAGGGLQAHSQGGEVEGPGWGSSGPHPGGLQAHTRGVLQAHTWGGILQAPTWGMSPGPHPRGSPGPHQGGIPACTEADSPNRQLLLRAVRILLECILVLFLCLHDWVKGPTFFSSKFINSFKFRRYAESRQSDPIENLTKNNIQMYLSVEKHLPATT